MTFRVSTNLVGGLLLLVALLIGSSLGLVGETLLLSEGLPALTKDLADLTYKVLESCAVMRMVRRGSIPKAIPGFSLLTFSRCSLAKNM